MAGLIGLVATIAVLAAVCAFLIEYDQASRRFAKKRAQREAAKTGVAAVLFFAALGTVLVAVLVH